jgi:hypothetical protein
MDTLMLTKHFLRYTSLGAVVYVSFRFFPYSKLTSQQAMVLVALVLIVYFVIEYLCGSFNNLNTNVKITEKNDDAKIKDMLENFSDCSCSAPPKVEMFTTDAGITQPVQNQTQFVNELNNIITQREKLTNPLTLPPTPNLSSTNIPVPPAPPVVYTQLTAPPQPKQSTELDQLKQRVHDLENLLTRQSPTTGSTPNLDPFDNAGYRYSTKQNRLTEVDESIPPELRRIGKDSDMSREKDGVATSDMVYTDYNHLPVADGYQSHAYEYGDWYLPPEKWYPQPPNPPVCVTEKKCPVCPVYTTGAPVDVKEWFNSSRITPPDIINTDYIKQKLNSGR